MVVCLRQNKPDIVILENVIGADPDLPKESLGDLYDCQCACVDPRPVAGVRMARERLIWVLLKRATMRWAVKKSLREMLELLAVGKTRMAADEPFANPDAQSFRAMDSGEVPPQKVTKS